MATLFLMGEEGAIKQLYSRDSVKAMLFHKETLLVFLPVYLLMAGFVGGLTLPFGTFGAYHILLRRHSMNLTNALCTHPSPLLVQSPTSLWARLSEGFLPSLRRALWASAALAAQARTL